MSVASADGDPGDFERFISGEQFDSNLATAIAEFDKVQTDLYDFLKLAKENVNQVKNLNDGISLNLEPQNRAILNLTNNILTTTSDPQDRVNILSTLWMDDIRKRYAVIHQGDFNNDDANLDIVEENIHENVEAVQRVSNSDKSFLGNFLDIYNKDLLEDVQSFLNELLNNATKTEEKKPQKTPREIARLVGKNVLDVAKLAAGISAGLAISRLVEKRFFNK